MDGALPFGYESTGSETRFTCGLDPIAASRVECSPSIEPETLAHWVDEHVRLGGFATTAGGSARLLPQLEPDAPGLWPAQAEAIRNLEESLRENRPRALIQMATGAGKTFTAANLCYRLVRHAGAEQDPVPGGPGQPGPPGGAGVRGLHRSRMTAASSPSCTTSAGLRRHDWIMADEPPPRCT